MEGTNQSKTKKLIIILVIILICTIVLTVSLLINHKYNNDRNTSNFNIKKVVSVGQKDGALYLITDTLQSAKIYKFDRFYPSEVIVRGEYIYINYYWDGKTKYVDVINLKENFKTRVTIDEIKNDNLDKDLSVYFYLEEYKGYIKDLRTGEVTLDEGKNDCRKAGYNCSDTSVKYNEDIEAIYDYENVINKVFIYNNKTKKNTEIYEITQYDAILDNISMIGDDILQIGVAHYPSDGSVCYVDEWHYYNFKTKKMMNIDIEGFSDIILLHLDEINYDQIIDDEDIGKEVDEWFDVSQLEDSKSTTDKRILLDYNKKIDEKDVIKAVNISEEDFNKYKDKFIGKESDNTFSELIMEQREYKELSERNFLVLENFILKADDLVSDRLVTVLNEKVDSRYNLMHAKILSGMVNYYIGDIEELEVTKWRKVPSGGYEIDLVVNSNYVLSYCFGDENEVYEDIELMIYEGTTSFDDIYNNYNEYENGENTYLSIMIMSYDSIGYWDFFMNNNPKLNFSKNAF